MIKDTTAQRIASDWHGGQSSALYALSSSGAIIDGCADEITDNIAEAVAQTEKRRLSNLLTYVQANGPRDAQPNWYQHVICKR